MEFSEKYKRGDTIYFWLPDYGGLTAQISEWHSEYNAYLTRSSIYVREGDAIFASPEELRQYSETHQRNRETDCGYSFGCDFL